MGCLFVCLFNWLYKNYLQCCISFKGFPGGSDSVQQSNLVTHTYISEKAMAPYFSTLAWKIPWMEEPGRLQSMELQRVEHDWTTSLSFFTFMHWRRNYQPTPVFLPGESQGRGSLVGCSLWGRTESDTSDLATAYIHLLFSKFWNACFTLPSTSYSSWGKTWLDSYYVDIDSLIAIMLLFGH